MSDRPKNPSERVSAIETEPAKLNMVTNPEAAWRAICAIEDMDGPGYEKIDEAAGDQNSFGGCKKWLEGESSKDIDGSVANKENGSVYVIYGGNLNRYYVDQDGTVKISKMHLKPNPTLPLSEGAKTKLQKAIDLGFEIV